MRLVNLSEELAANQARMTGLIHASKASVMSDKATTPSTSRWSTPRGLHLVVYAGWLLSECLKRYLVRHLCRALLRLHTEPATYPQAASQDIESTEPTRRGCQSPD